MALVALMDVGEVKLIGNERWVPCSPGEEGARDPAEVFENYHYGVPFWLRDAPAIRLMPGQQQEHFVLNCVRTHNEDDPNGMFFTASPNGGLHMTMENPEGFGYVRPGRRYRVTIEEVRGPRLRDRVAEATND